MPDTSSNQPLILAVPSKGRLQEKAQDFFKNCGLQLKRPGGDRNYRGCIEGLNNLEIAYLSASDIAKELSSGGAHIGITGLDLIHESISDPDKNIASIAKLGFGHTDVVVSVPQSWIDVNTMDDLEDVAADFRIRHGRRLRVATKYINLTRSFFAHHNIIDYQIVESLGATEGAPASGAADLIVDITTTGNTLRANSLKILNDGIILKSEAHLVASLKAQWKPEQLACLATMLQRIAAFERAQEVVEIRAAISDQARQGRIVIERFDAKIPFGAVGGSGPLVIHCPKKHMWACVEWLKTVNAETIAIQELDYIVEMKTPRFESLITKLKSL